MKKIISKLLIFVFFFSIQTVSAKTTASTGVYEINIRTLPDSSSFIKYTIPANKRVTVLNDTKISGSGCDNANWFEIEYLDYQGYVCSKYLTNIINDDPPKEEVPSDENPTDTPEYPTEEIINIEEIYEEELNKFPKDYQIKIEELHKIYPNAIFKAQNINVSFDNFSTYQYKGYDKINGCSFQAPIGKSLLEDLDRSRDGLKSIESWAYDPLTDTFKTSYYGGEQGRWYAPSLNTVKYYVDPRNFLTNNKVFMFEELTYAGNYYTISNIEKMLLGTFMSKKNVTGKENTTFAQTFIDAGKKHNINPYFLVSRVIQEVGTTRSTIVSGTWENYNREYYGYYNFYNIKAAGNTKEETIKNGLKYAKSQNWNNEYDAIVGGATFLAADYISQGQNTTYFQKFDVYGPCYGFHQYMQNIEAPYNEVNKVYNAYRNADLLQSNFVFIIPVYKSMPTNTFLDNPKNSNNYLRNLTINGTTIEGFNYKKQEYTINVSPLISSVEIAATKASTKSTIIGTGKFELKDTSQTKEIVVTAENGSKNTYKITVTRDTNIPISISEILNTMLINSDGTYISSIELSTKASEFIDKAKEIDENAEITIKNIKDELKTEKRLATGDKVTIKSGEETKTFEIVIYGDVDGNGDIDALDYVRIKNHIMSSTLKDANKIAADIDKNGKIDALDYVNIKNSIMGTYTIVQ